MNARALVLMIGIAVLGPACAAAAPSGESGIEGRVLLGPQCPVEVEGSPCPDRPVAATVSVRTLEGDEVTTFRSEDDGRFRVALDPGSYVLVAEPGDVGMFAKPVEVTVRASEYADVVVLIDTGIR